MEGCIFMKTVLFVPLLLLSAIAVSGTFSFAPPYYMECAGTPIDVGNYGSPCIVDWDGDGLKDMITGQFDYGRIRFYKNEGTNEDPIFNSYAFLQANGSMISMGYG